MSANTVKTTHDFGSSVGTKCVACGLMLKNVAKKPTCKMLTNAKPYEIDPEAELAFREHRHPGDISLPAPKPKKKFHHFGSSDTCIYCGMYAANEFKKPHCPRKGNKVSSSTKPVKSYEPCHVTHPVLKFGELEIHGGSCCSPKVKGCDIYIGFDHGMQMTTASMPWKRGTKGHVEEVYYHVTDMTAPKQPKEFKALVEWTLEQMKAGKKIHAGCIGGHGRTGTFFAALAAMQNEVVVEDAVQFVRDNYCKKAVECTEQIKFLKKHFGVETKVKPSKSWGGTTGTTKGSKKVTKWADRWEDEKVDDQFDVIKPEPRPHNVWGRTLGEEDI